MPCAVETTAPPLWNFAAELQESFSVTYDYVLISNIVYYIVLMKSRYSFVRTRFLGRFGYHHFSSTTIEFYKNSYTANNYHPSFNRKHLSKFKLFFFGFKSLSAPLYTYAARIPFFFFVRELALYTRDICPVSVRELLNPLQVQSIMSPHGLSMSTIKPNAGILKRCL